MIWHYTIGQYIERIIESGMLKPTDCFILPGEQPILWFSANRLLGGNGKQGRR